MASRIAPILSNLNVTLIASALAIVTAVGSSSQAATTRDIFHHWPDFGDVSAAADKNSSRDVVRLWPCLASIADTTDGYTNRYIYRHPGHLALVAGYDNDATPDIFHHWPDIS